MATNIIRLFVQTIDSLASSGKISIYCTSPIMYIVVTIYVWCVLGEDLAIPDNYPSFAAPLQNSSNRQLLIAGIDLSRAS